MIWNDETGNLHQTRIAPEPSRDFATAPNLCRSLGAVRLFGFQFWTERIVSRDGMNSLSVPRAASLST